MKNTNLYLIGIIIFLLFTGWLGKNYYNKKILDAKNEIRTLTISKSQLLKINDEQYRKLVGDTLTQKQLNKIVDSLKIKLEAKPKIIVKTVFVPKEQENSINNVVISKDSLVFNDYYPNKENYFINYLAKINLNTQKGVGKFTFTPIELSLIISQREDGIYQLDAKTPNWLIINDIKVQSIPLSIPKIDNFGWIIGGGYGKDYNTFENYFRLNAGFRWNKIYFLGGINTNGNADVNINLEL